MAGPWEVFEAFDDQAGMKNEDFLYPSPAAHLLMGHPLPSGGVKMLDASGSKTPLLE
jgi:hypothetical protein